MFQKKKDTAQNTCRSVKVFALAISAASILSCAHQRAKRQAPPALNVVQNQEAEQLIRAAEFDVGKYDVQKRQQLWQISQEMRCPCDELNKSVLSECAAQTKKCPRIKFAARTILRGIDRDEPPVEINQRLLERFGPRDLEKIDLASAPCRGPQNAPVTITVFSDFQCPFCGLGAKLIEALEKEAALKERVRFCFKNYPLTQIHPLAQYAAQAAMAAHEQGKFWQMHDLLFGNQQDLNRETFIEHAKELGLDVDKFMVTLDAEATRQRVISDLKEAQRMQIRGTPSFFVNGREMTDPKTIADFIDWVDESIALEKK